MIESIIQTFLGWPARIQIYFGVAVFLIACGVLFMVVILFSQFYKGLKKDRSERHRSAIQQELSKLASQASNMHIPDAARHFRLTRLTKLVAKNEPTKELVLSELISLKQNILGDGADFLIQSYVDLGLRELSLQKLKSLNWKIVAQGLRELEVMEQRDCQYLFINFLQHRNYQLRKEARLGLVSLADNPLFFLDSLKDRLTEWETIFIFKKLRRRDHARVPNFSEWYNHTNESVVLFAVRMTALFGQFQNTEALTGKLTDKREAVRLAIVQALTKIEAFQAQEAIMEFFDPSLSPEIRIACLRYFASLGDDRCIASVAFELNATEEEVRFEAVKAMLHLQPTYHFHTEEAYSMAQHLKSPLLQ